MLNPSDQCLALIKSFEGCRLIAYLDSADVLTIGYGHTGPDVFAGLVINQESADWLFQRDVKRIAAGVWGLLRVPVSQCQFDALVSFAFNVGVGALAGSHLLARLNSGDVDGASEQFTRWDHAGGVQVAGLLRRREAEQAMYLGSHA